MTVNFGVSDGNPTLRTKPIRVVQVIPIDGVGGVEIAARSALLPCSVMTFALAPIGGAVSSTISGTVLLPRYNSPNDPRALIDAVRRVLRFKPDVVIGSLWRSVPLLIVLRLIRPQVLVVYFLHLQNTVHFADWLLGEIGIHIADAVWCDSIATQSQRLSLRQKKRSRVISFVTEHARPLVAKRSATPRFVIWARLHRQKGIDRAIKLISLLAAQGIDARFDVFGPDGGEGEALNRAIVQANLSGRVSMRGVMLPHDRVAVASRATFYLQLSRSEGMAMSVVEAMQIGLIPVVTRVGEIGHYVQDGQNGLIVDPDNLPIAVERIIAMLRDPDQVAAMAASAVLTWERATLYREDIAVAADALCNRHHHVDRHSNHIAEKRP